MPDRILLAIGTRPECIKLAPVVDALRRRPEDFTTIVVRSYQHGAILDQTAASIGLAFDESLPALPKNLSLAAMTSALVTQFAQSLERLKPDRVIVQGDTATAAAAALAAAYAQIPVAHVEAGLRSGDTAAPFPEEINRRLITNLASLHFAPAQRAVDALLKEGIAPQTVRLTGNTVVDMLEAQRARIEAPGGEQLVSAPIREICAHSDGIVLVTCHRRENLGADLAILCRALIRIAAAFPRQRIIFPVHPNPRLREGLLPELAELGTLSLIEPVPYIDMLYLLAHSALLLTDSGGLQEEAPSFGVPTLVLRRVTERSEAIDAGLAELVGLDEERIVSRTIAHLSGSVAKRAITTNPFGDGRAAGRIVDNLAEIGAGRLAVVS
jgi:UDP-N-acetylglucosamine 2-epimerase (non-hydrolysing)